MKKRKDSKNRVLKDGEYQRKDGTYEYRYKDMFGKRVSVYGKTLDILRDKEAEILKKPRFCSANRDVITFDDLWKEWLLTKTNIRNTTRYNYITLYKSNFEPVLGNMALHAITRPFLRQLFQYYGEQHRDKFVESLYTLINQILKFAEEEEYIPKNPAKGIRKYSKTKTYSEDQTRIALTKVEQHRFEEWLEIYRFGKWKDVFIVMLWTGMRIGETAALTWDCVDFSMNKITVNKTFVTYSMNGKCVYDINFPKTASGNRNIPMFPQVREVLLRLQNDATLKGVQSKTEYAGHRDFVFLNDNGNPIHRTNIESSLRLCCMNYNKTYPLAPLPILRPHELRHTFATRMIEKGVNVKVLQSVLGHKNLETTMNLYVHSSEEFKDAEFRRISSALLEEKPSIEELSDKMKAQLVSIVV